MLRHIAVEVFDELRILIAIRIVLLILCPQEKEIDFASLLHQFLIDRFIIRKRGLLPPGPFIRIDDVK